MAIKLSKVEKDQLGKRKLLQNQTYSDYSYTTAKLWPLVRQYLVERSLRANPKLDKDLTAYTPGETQELLEHPKILSWHHQVSNFRVPKDIQIIAFVPCAKTKPWTGPSIFKSQLYTAYNQLALEFPQVYFVTVSEPLGIVPYQRWGDFPQYDNPGLFKDDALRSGLTTQSWIDSPFGQKYLTPFAEKSYTSCIEILAQVIADFVSQNSSHHFISFVENADGSRSTHAHMLIEAQKLSNIPITPYLKKPTPRHSPYQYIKTVLQKELSIQRPSKGF